MDGVCIQRLYRRIESAVEGVEGWLTRREAEFLALAAASPTAKGDVLEIGSFRGRSTIALAMAMEAVERADLDDQSQLFAIDPLRDDDPLMSQPESKGSARRAFDINLTAAGIRDRVELLQDFSYNVAGNWRRPLRLLWIDGDHSYRSTKQDFDLFSPFLADGAILAMHDVLSRYDGCIRVFTEDVLTSPKFGPVGLCGSIGWAQFRRQGAGDRSIQRSKERVLNRLKPLLPFHTQAAAPRGLAKIRYKWLRSRVPHGAIDSRRWQQIVQAA